MIESNRFQTISEILQWRVAHHPDQLAYRFLKGDGEEEMALSFHMLDIQAKSIASLLLERGTSGKPVLLLYPPGPEYITALFGCLYSGSIAVPAYPPRLKQSLSRLSAIQKDCHAVLGLTTQSLHQRNETAFVQLQKEHGLDWICTDSPELSSVSTTDAVRWEGTQDSIAFLQYTSGSTGDPKGVQVSHGNLLANEAMIHQGFRVEEGSVAVSWLPFYHDMGLISGLLQPIYSGVLSVLMAPISFLQQPVRWLEAISSHRATISGGPNFAYDLCARKIKDEEKHTLDLSSWQVAFNGSEPIRVETLDRFARAFESCGFQKSSFFPCYGMAEATVFIAGPSRVVPPTLLAVDRKKLEQNQIVEVEGPESQVMVGCGQSWMEQQVKIVDPHAHTECSAGQVGEIWVSGPHVAQGYWNRPEENERTFHAVLSESGEGPFLRTGDLGYWHNEQLFITGRLKDLLIIRGRNHYPQDLEKTVEGCHPALRPEGGAAFAIDGEDAEKLVMVHEVERQYVRNLEISAIVQAMRDSIAQAHEVQVHAVLLLKPGKLPKTSSGKVRRRACKEGFLNDTLEAIGTEVFPDVEMEEKQDVLLWSTLSSSQERIQFLEQYLLAKVSTIFRIPKGQIDHQKPLPHFGMDSLMAIELKHQLESELDLLLPIEAFYQEKGIAALAQELAVQQSESSTMQCVPRNQIFPLSPIQQQIAFLHQMGLEKLYQIHAVFQLAGPLKVDFLKEAFEAVVKRHEILRTTFPEEKGGLQQTIGALELLPFAEFNLEANRAEEQHECLQKQVQNTTFDLTTGPLVQTALFRVGPESHWLLLSLHHIIADGWSVGILMREWGEHYRSLVEKKTPNLPSLPIQYVDYTLWQREQSQGKTSISSQEYWQKKLSGIPEGVKFPTDPVRPQQASFLGATQSMVLPTELMAPLHKICEAQGTTLFTALLALAKIQLFCWTQQKDIVVGTVTSNRDSVETRALIGCFMNFLPLRSQIFPRWSGLDLMAHLKETLLEAYAHQECSFEKIVEVVNPERIANQNPIYNVAFLFQNFLLPSDSSFSESLKITPLPFESQTALLDIRWIAHEVPEGIRLECEYNADLFTEHTIQALLKNYQEMLVHFTQDPERPLDEFPLNDALKQQTQHVAKPSAQKTLVIAANFTADPIQEALDFWIEELGIAFDVEFAPYNQVFQSLLDPSGNLLQNRNGVNVLLLRLEEWLIEPRLVDEFTQALQSAQTQGNVPFLIFLCPPSQKVLDDATRLEELRALESQWGQRYSANAGITIIAASEVLQTYPVGNYDDPVGNELGHIPYTAEFFAALGTALLRKVHAFFRSPSKVIVLDCDGTLWKGVCAEDDTVEVDPARLAFQEFLIRQQEQGVLLCLCSKNKEDDVFEVFEHHEKMALTREHLVAWRINWKPKSENIQSLATELNLGLDSFIFIDDNPVEWAEVQAHCPTLISLLLPEDPNHISDFLKNNWAFDQQHISQEDRQRTQWYQENLQREQYLQKSLNNETFTLQDFLEKLQLDIQIVPLESAQWERAAQLSHRTNQFNFIKNPRSVLEIQQYVEESNRVCKAVQVQDRFGDYGVVGILFAEKVDSIFSVDTFLLSCRALGRGVEHQMMKNIAETAREQKCSFVEATCFSTSRNRPARDFLHALGTPVENGDSLSFRFPVETLLHLAYKPSSQLSISGSEKESSSAPWLEPEMYQKLGSQWQDVSGILEAVQDAKIQSHTPSGGDRTEPRNPIEEVLVGICKRILKQQQMGIHQNFFEVGGNSLLATQVVSQVRSTFRVKLQLMDLFQNPTVEGLGQCLLNEESAPGKMESIARLRLKIDRMSPSEVQAMLQQKRKNH